MARAPAAAHPDDAVRRVENMNRDNVVRGAGDDPLRPGFDLGEGGAAGRSARESALLRVAACTGRNGQWLQ
jgi:hypothetical protein